MQLRVDAELDALTRDLQLLSIDHKVLVCTSNRPFALALATSFALAHTRNPDQLLGICTRPDEALTLIAAVNQPVLAFVSEQLDDGSGLELVRQLKDRPAVAPVVSTVLTLASLDPVVLRRALHGPCDALLTQRGLHVALLVAALEAVIGGFRFVDPVASFVLREQLPDDHPQLTQREAEVLRLVCEGLTNREIGAQLHIAETTARGHVQSIIQKLHVRDRTAAAAEGVRRHLVD